MKPLVFFLFLVLPLFAQAESETNTQQPVAVSVCQILTDSPVYAGKLVQVRGQFHRTLEWSAIEEKGCEGRILVVDPKHPNVTPRPEFRIVEDQAWHEFEKSSKERLPAEPNGVCVGPCGSYKHDVVATFVGRLDSGDVRNRTGKLEHQSAFGHLGQFRVRLVLKSVSDVVATLREKP